MGESITFSAGTVIVALLCLLLASFGLYSGLGPALAIGVAIMLLAALTLTPALLAVFGRAVFWPAPIRQARREGPWARLTDRVIAHPVATLVLGVLFLGGLSAAASAYTSSGFGGTSTGPPGSDSAAGTAAINSHYPAVTRHPAGPGHGRRLRDTPGQDLDQGLRHVTMPARLHSRGARVSRRCRRP